MRAKDNMRTAAEVLVDQLLVHGVRHVFCVPGESYLAVLDAFHDSDLAVTVCRQEGGACHDGGSGRQGDRPARRLLRHPRAGRHQCLARHPHRAAGFDAAGHVRRPGGARHARARGVSGTRLSRRVRLDDQMGDRDRRSGARAGDRVARLLYRGQRPARAGGGRHSRGHADRARRRRATRRRSRWSRPRPGRPRWRNSPQLLAGARAPIMLLGGSRWSQAASDAVARFAQKYALPVVHHVPPRPSVRRAASLLRRRSRHRSQSETDRAHQGGRPRRPGRRPARRIAVAELHAVRHSRPADAVRPCASGRRGTRPRLQPASRHPRDADRFRRGARQSRRCTSARGDAEAAHADYLAWTEKPTEQPGGVNFGAVMVWLRENLPPDAILCNGAGNYAAVDSPLLPLPPLRPARGADRRARWAMACRRRWR